jgi:hypothetical protein
MNQPDIMTGGCLCGAVRYRVGGTMRQIVACHCGQCHRTHGNFAAYSACDRDALSFDEDRGLKWFQSSDKARRGFCGECGASLFWEPTFDSYVAVSAGTLDRSDGLKLVRHIFTGEKPDWYEIKDGLEAFAESMYGRTT